MPGEDPKYCFEFWECPEEKQEKCPARTVIPAKNCWAFGCAGQPKTKRNFSFCWECPWFQKIASDPYAA
jgi:hypothetical protein